MSSTQANSSSGRSYNWALCHISLVMDQATSTPIVAGAWGFTCDSPSRRNPRASGTPLLRMLALSWWISTRSTPGTVKAADEVPLQPPEESPHANAHTADRAQKAKCGSRAEVETHRLSAVGEPPTTMAASLFASVGSSHWSYTALGETQCRQNRSPRMSQS